MVKLKLKLNNIKMIPNYYPTTNWSVSTPIAGIPKQYSIFYNEFPNQY